MYIEIIAVCAYCGETSQVNHLGVVSEKPHGVDGVLATFLMLLPYGWLNVDGQVACDACKEAGFDG